MAPTLDRRGFLQGAAAGGIGAAAQALGLAGWQRSALAADRAGSGPWGELAGTIVGTQSWDCQSKSYKILEIFQIGGASQWESLWLTDSHNMPDFNAFHLDRLPLDHLIWTGYGSFNCQNPLYDPSLPAAYTHLVGNSQVGVFIPASKNYKFFANAEDGAPIYWGAPAKPLWDRPDIFARCRMVTLGNNFPPHEVAIPYCLTGFTLGNQRMFGTAAAIEHRARSVDPQRVLPASYVLQTVGGLADSPVAATGQHPGYSRPLVIGLRNDNAFYDNLGRPNIPGNIRDASDNLFLALRHGYRDRLQFPNAASLVRSAGFDGYWAAAEMLKNAPVLQDLFAGNLLQIDPADPSIEVCPTFPSNSTHTVAAPGFLPGTKRMLHAAASLLSSNNPARYVCIIDNGLTDAGYDTHGNANGGELHLHSTCANYYNLLKHLASNIHDPVSNPDGLIDLNDTMVVITTEFGRTAYVNDVHGRDHHTDGYVATLIGGPIGARSIGGAIDKSSGAALSSYRYSATDIRGAMLLAAGVDPFAEHNFRDADFSPALTNSHSMTSEAAIRKRLKENILGVA